MNRRRLIHDDAASGEIRDAWADPVSSLDTVVSRQVAFDNRLERHLVTANRRAIATDAIAWVAASAMIGAIVIFLAIILHDALSAAGMVQ